MNDKIVIKFNIYFKNDKIGSCVLNILENSFWFTTSILNSENKIFDEIKDKIDTWLISRIPQWNYSYVQLTSWLYDYYDLRLKNGLFIHSLNYNGFNWVDKCWLSPDEDIDFEYGKQKISFHVTTYEELLQSWRQFLSNNKFSFTERLRWSNLDKKYFSLVESTNAEKPIFWYYKDGELLLQKFAKLDILKKEHDTLNQFSEYGIIIPKTEITIVSDDEMAYITKKCLVTENTNLISVFQINRSTPHEVINFIRANYKIDKCEYEKFDKIVNLCELHNLKTTNFGFLIDNGVAKVAVWSNPIIIVDKFFETDFSKINLNELFNKQ